MSPELSGSLGSNPPDPSDSAAVVEFIVGLVKAYSGGSPYHDEAATRELVERDVARTRNVASCLTNHFVIDTGTASSHGLDEIDVPTLVVHGERDPVFPLAHGEALQRKIPGAKLLVLEAAGHELPPPLWDVFVPALIEHTATG
jgi:pimeloyl-ACP methyl ester carboxylesterase